jgi:hypothetical protein
MIACVFILGDVRGDLSMESVMLDTVADAAAAMASLCPERSCC